MGLLTGSISVTRFDVLKAPEEPGFDAVAFHEIPPGSEVRESTGFVPYEPGAPWEVGARRFAFRVRIDTLKADPTRVRERLKELVQTEMDATGAPFVGPKKRKELRHLAEEELIVRQAPRSKVIECALDGATLYVGSTAKRYLGTVTHLLRKAGVEVTHRTPWIEHSLAEPESEIVEAREEPESVLGCRFLNKLPGDREFIYEPENGRVVLATTKARVTLVGEVLRDLHRYLDEGAEVLTAKLLHEDLAFTLDALPFRIKSLRVPPIKTNHWTESLDERLARIGELWDALDRKFVGLVK